jgi:serine/threonine protein kinase
MHVCPRRARNIPDLIAPNIYQKAFSIVSFHNMQTELVLFYSEKMVSISCFVSGLVSIMPNFTLDALQRHSSVQRPLSRTNPSLCKALSEFPCTGECCSVRCTLKYAPPEAVIAHKGNSNLVVHPALDMWAIGVILFESLTKRSTVQKYSGYEEVCKCAEGAKKYPWEQPMPPREWRKSRAYHIFSSCLARDPAKRPTAKQALQSLLRLNETTTTG